MILIGLGSNLDSKYGTPRETLAAAKAALAAQGLKILKSSRTWLTAPVPVSEQPWYHNEVIEVHTLLQPGALLGVLQGVEADFGRMRDVKNAPRTLDLDLLTYHDTIIQSEEARGALIVPHPEMHRRAFVLLPMADIVPEWTHPVSGRNLMNLICTLPDGQEAKPLVFECERKLPGGENAAA